jgi:hypothetical protein
LALRDDPQAAKRRRKRLAERSKFTADSASSLSDEGFVSLYCIHFNASAADGCDGFFAGCGKCLELFNQLAKVFGLLTGPGAQPRKPSNVLGVHSLGYEQPSQLLDGRMWAQSIECRQRFIGVQKPLVKGVL